MSKDTMSKIRSGDVWKRLERVLNDYHIPKSDWSVEDVRPHPKLTVTFCGETKTMSFPGTPSSRFSCRRSEADLRRMLVAMQMEAIAKPSHREHEEEEAAGTYQHDERSVTVCGVPVGIVSYKGEPVVTFAMVDKVHQRPEGTAGRTFRENRGRFVEGEDFSAVSIDEIRRLVPSLAEGRSGGKPITLITRRGYLKLVKPLTDDRAWEVQGEMIDRYFMVESVGLGVGKDQSSSPLPLIQPGSIIGPVNGYARDYVAKPLREHIARLEHHIDSMRLYNEERFRASHDRDKMAIEALRSVISALGERRSREADEDSQHVFISAAQILADAGVAEDVQAAISKKMSFRAAEWFADHGVMPISQPVGVNRSVRLFRKDLAARFWVECGEPYMRRLVGGAA